MIEMKNVYKVYENGVVALRKINIEFPNSGMIAIIGESGCGKSTLINLLSANDSPSKGEITYNNVSYKEVGKKILTQKFAYIYQDFKLIENMTVYQNIIISHELSNIDIDYDYVIGIARKLEIDKLLDEKIYALSGGQMQRVAIARALARRPEVIFADEPTGNLDSKNTDNLYKILREISSSCLIVMVTHDKGIDKWADRIIKLKDGRVTEDKENSPDLEYISDVSTPDYSEDCEKSNTGNKRQRAFTYKKGASRTRKKAGISAVSITGLTLAFNNKGIVKKIVLTIIAMIMVGFIMMSTSMIFSTYEQTFVKNMKKNNVPYISIRMDASKENYLTEEDKINFKSHIKAKYGADMFYSTNGLVNYNFYQYEPASDVEVPQYFKDIRFSSLKNDLFINNPSELGIDIIIGEAPKARKEIAISKTYYDYIMHIRKFERFSGPSQEIGKVIEFNSQDDIIGKYILEFNFTITGVFEDNFPYKNFDSLINLYNQEGFLDKSIKNKLYNIVIRPEIEADNVVNFYNEGSYYRLTYKYNNSFNNKKNLYSAFIPANEVTRDYYHTNRFFRYDLAPGEIVIPNYSFIEEYEKMTDKKLQIGDTIELTYVKTKFEMIVGYSVVEEYETKKFVIKDMATKYDKDSTWKFIMNENDYNEWSSISTLPNAYYINSKYVNTAFMCDVNDFYYENIGNHNKGKTKDYFSLFYDMDYYANMSWELMDFVELINKYISVPLFILSLTVLSILISINLSDTIKAKAKDVLILNSLGATKTDIFKIFGVTTLVLAIAQAVVGLLIGYGMLSLFNYLTALIERFVIYYDTFWIGGANIALSFAAIIIGNILALIYNIGRIDNKNLRKSFQNQKK